MSSASLSKADVAPRSARPNPPVSTLTFRTTQPLEFVDITPQVQKAVQECGGGNGCVLVYSKHTTAAVAINENEPLLVQDMEQFLDRCSPRQGNYRHNDFTVRTVNMTENESADGHAHCQHFLLNTSETIPLVDGVLQLGTWQRIFLIELDGPRQRHVVVQIMRG